MDLEISAIELYAIDISGPRKGTPDEVQMVKLELINPKNAISLNAEMSTVVCTC